MLSISDARETLPFDLLLERAGLLPAEVLVLRHRAPEPGLKTLLPWLYVERPEVFDAYQSLQRGAIAGAVRRAKYVAALVGLEPRSGVFAGLYAVGEEQRLAPEQLGDLPEIANLRDLGMAEDFFSGEVSQFELQRTSVWTEWAGKLTLGWSPPERSWFRWADRNTFPVLAITPESQFGAGAPAWDSMTLTWAQLTTLPISWRAALSQWRGIYYVYDAARRAGYVGSASGAENLLGRWREYAVTGHGGNRELRGSKPEDLRFSILQRMGPDALPGEVAALETSWKLRLHTREFGLNAN